MLFIDVIFNKIPFSLCPLSFTIHQFYMNSGREVYNEIVI